MRQRTCALMLAAGISGALVPQQIRADTPAPPTRSAADLMHDETITGEVIADGVLCPQFRTDTGEDISIEALPAGAPDLKPGDRLRLTGQFIRVSRCMQGRGFVVSQIDAPPLFEDE